MQAFLPLVAISPRPVSSGSSQVAAHDVTISIEKLAGLLLLPDVAHASVPSLGSNFSEASLVRVEDINLPAVVRPAHTAQPDARPGGGGGLGASGLAGAQQLLDGHVQAAEIF